ncbi:MAG: short-chain fatty acyl-CoA regulator family protein [Alphaproteobacteria bacterium]
MSSDESVKAVKPSAAADRLGARIRRLRRQRGLSQTALAGRLGISASYLNLIEHNRRSVTVPLLLKLAELFELELSDVATGEDDGRLVAELMEVFADPVFDACEVRGGDVRDLVAGNPAIARAIVALHDAWRHAKSDAASLAIRDGDGSEPVPGEPRQPAELVSDFLQAAGNHFPALEAAAERVAHDVALTGEGAVGGLSVFLANAFGVRIAVLPSARGQGAMRRYDPETRTLLLSEMLPGASRAFQMAHQLALLAADEEIDRALDAGGLAEDGEARTLGRIALANYFAGAVLMPYVPFLEAAKALRYDVELLAHRFSMSFEQVCHRLTNLQRPGWRGVPFHMLRTDIAGNISKRISLSGIHIPRHGGLCPRWNVHAAYLRPGTIIAQVSLMPDGEAYFCIARSVRKGTAGHGAPQSWVSIGLGCRLEHARELVYADGMDLASPDVAVPAGVSCRTCPRLDCRQRAFPPVSRRLGLDENVRGPSAWTTPGA